MVYAPMVETYGLGHHVLQRGQVQPGESVVILGAGKLGLSVLDVLCHSAGAALTIVADIPLGGLLRRDWASSYLRCISRHWLSRKHRLLPRA
jgi:Zn-dependent alcohol dehydrogenase